MPAATLASDELTGQTCRAIADTWRGMVPERVKDPKPPDKVLQTSVRKRPTRKRFAAS